jgi:hypothetical protein
MFDIFFRCCKISHIAKDAFYGHDETYSLNKGNYREMVEWYKDKVEVVNEAYEKGSKNC